MMPYAGSNINGCDCPANFPVSGVLIDGVTPSIDTTQHGTWARELFTVRRNGRDSITIGFQFSSDINIQIVEVILFNCPVQGIGVTGVKVYSSFAFPQFLSLASSLLVTYYSSAHSDNCQSLSTISIPIQLPMASSNQYFIDFLFAGGSSIYQLNWLYLGDIRFSDDPPTIVTTAMTEIATENEGRH